MLLLTSTSDKLQVVTDASSDIEVHASWMDLNGSTVTPGRANNAGITTATTTDVVPSPGASTSRNVKALMAHNNHASTSCLVSVVHTDGTNAAELVKATLLPGESLGLDESGRWTHYDSNGTEKQATAKLDICLRVTADSVHATAATWASITGLAYQVKSGVRYAFDACLFHVSNATTTGAQFGIGGVAMTSMLAGAISTVTNSATAATMSAGTATAVDTATVVQTTGSSAVAPTMISGSFQPSADGTFALRATSEVSVANGLTVKAGSWLWLRELDN